jgi:hypothetical protein
MYLYLPASGYWRSVLATSDSFWIRFCLLAQSYVLVYVLTNWGNEGASGRVIYFEPEYFRNCNLVDVYARSTLRPEIVTFWAITPYFTIYPQNVA